MARGISGKVDAADFARLAAATKDADKDVARGVRKAFREVGKPLGMGVMRDGSKTMPSRGGLRAKLETGKVGLLFSNGNNPKLTLKVGTKPGIGLKSLNAGRVRHPVFGRRGKGEWRSQRVPMYTYDAAFKQAAPTVRRELVKAAEKVFDDIARKV